MGRVGLVHAPIPRMHLDPVLELVVLRFAVDSIELEEHVGVSHFSTLLKWSRSTPPWPSRDDGAQAVDTSLRRAIPRCGSIIVYFPVGNRDTRRSPISIPSNWKCGRKSKVA